MSFPDLDLQILKVLFENKRAAIEFASYGESKVFTPSLWKYGQCVIDYIKVYKEVPTPKVLVECYGKNNEATVKYLNNISSQVEAQTLCEKEFPHNIKKIKDRYAHSLLSNLKIDPDKQDINESLKSIQNVYDSVKSLYSAKTFDQKTIKDALGDFRQRYLAKSRDPNFGRLLS